MQDHLLLWNTYWRKRGSYSCLYYNKNTGMKVDGWGQDCLLKFWCYLRSRNRRGGNRWLEVQICCINKLWNVNQMVEKPVVISRSINILRHQKTSNRPVSVPQTSFYTNFYTFSCNYHLKEKISLSCQEVVISSHKAFVGRIYSDFNLVQG